eukprot:11888021-Alexandrium_andersonii.AAC.1
MASGVVHPLGGTVADDAPADVDELLMPARSSVAVAAYCRAQCVHKCICAMGSVVRTSGRQCSRRW